MSDYQDNPNNFEELEEAPQPQEPKAGPKPFTIAIIVIAGIFLLSLVALVAALLLKGPQQSSAVKEQADKINAQNTEVAVAATKRAVEVAALQLTLEAGSKAPAPTATLAPVATTPTAVIAVPTATSQPSTATPSTDMLTRTAVVATQLAQGTLIPGTPGISGTPGTGGVGALTPQPTSTALPTTGFVDEVGLPALFGLALALIAVVILARRMRLSAR